MTPDLEALGRRAVACCRWRWMGGMLWRYSDGRPGSRIDDSESDDDGTLDHAVHAVPDLSDPATMGCLLALVREAWRDPIAVAVVPAYMFPAAPRFWLACFGATDLSASTEAEALVLALESAP